MRGQLSNTATRTARAAATAMAGSMEHLGRWTGTALGLRTARRPPRPDSHKPPGSAPGIESTPDSDTPAPEGSFRLECIDYSRERIEKWTGSDLNVLFGRPRPEWVAARWINVDGLHPHTVKQFRQHFNLHTLAAEDVLHLSQRPKVENYDDHLFIVVRMIRLIEDALNDEQISMFFLGGTLVTFQERAGDVWDPVRERLEIPTSRLRQNDVSYLLYALLDAVVDHCFPLLEAYGDALEELDALVLKEPNQEVQRRIHGIKRDLILFRRNMWPLRDAVNTLYHDPQNMIPPHVETYLRDVYDHSIQVIDRIESYREMAASLTDLYMTAVSNRMNEIMKVLTILASFFIPTTFLAGVYGMNFDHIPELHWRYSYPVFWLVCLTLTAGLAVFFYRKGWLGGKR